MQGIADHTVCVAVLLKCQQSCRDTAASRVCSHCHVPELQAQVVCVSYAKSAMCASHVDPPAALIVFYLPVPAQSGFGPTFHTLSHALPTTSPHCCTLQQRLMSISWANHASGIGHEHRTMLHVHSRRLLRSPSSLLFHTWSDQASVPDTKTQLRHARWLCRQAASNRVIVAQSAQTTHFLLVATTRSEHALTFTMKTFLKNSTSKSSL